MENTTNTTASGIDIQITPMQSSDTINPALPMVNSLDYFQSQFQQDVNNFANQKLRVTGFGDLDAIQHSLYPGLYVLGAVSSLGKTTFIHQVAENLAAMGEHVLYFSLEQSAFELFSKSIARKTKSKNINSHGAAPLFTAIDIRNGLFKNTPPNEFYINQCIDEYTKAVQDRMHIIQTLFSIDVEGIQDTVNKFIQDNGVKPIVIVDYLQIITPSVINKRQLDARAAIDHIVHELKCFQSQNDLVVFLISSLNRQNYMTPIGFESFKESGGIEYTADVIWGLQLEIMNAELFAKEGNIKRKREVVNQAKRNTPRYIELVCLKNRFGISTYSAYFEYNAAFDYFENTLRHNDVIMQVDKKPEKKMEEKSDEKSDGKK